MRKESMVQLDFFDIAARQVSRLPVALQKPSDSSLHTTHGHPEIQLSPPLNIIHPHREPIYGFDHNEDEAHV